MITLLMSVYARERPEFLETAIQSLEAQTVAPDEILLIKDGPLSVPLEQIIEKYTAKIGIRSIQLPENVGLAKALNVGLAEARQHWIMRFDTDDFSCPERVARQKAIIASGNYDLFGSQIEEFDKLPSITCQSRFVPKSHEEILIYAQKRNPFNHMTVCYRKKLALQCGGYTDINFMEDYALWIKMLSAGAKGMNDPELLVKARFAKVAIKRRGGLQYVRSEVQLQSLMVREGFKSVAAALKDGMARSFVFLMPASIRSIVYKKFLRRAH